MKSETLLRFEGLTEKWKQRKIVLPGEVHPVRNSDRYYPTTQRNVTFQNTPCGQREIFLTGEIWSQIVRSAAHVACQSGIQRIENKNLRELRDILSVELGKHISPLLQTLFYSSLWNTSKDKSRNKCTRINDYFISFLRRPFSLPN
jgi:hypothetical protein